MKVNGTRTFFIALNTTKKPFDDPRVRQAANHALDKKLLIDRVLLGTAVPLNGVMSPDAFGYNPDLPAYKFDPAETKKLLAEAGYPNGIDVTLDVEGPFKEIAEAVASLLTKAGIRTTVAVGEGPPSAPSGLPKGEKKGDMYFTSWGNGSLDPADIFVPTLRTGDRGNSAGSTATPRWTSCSTPPTRRLDPAKRAEMYKTAQAMVNADAPWIFLWLPQDIYGVSKRLSGWQPSAGQQDQPARRLRELSGTRAPMKACRGRLAAAATHTGAARRQRHRVPDDVADAGRPGRDDAGGPAGHAGAGRVAAPRHGAGPAAGRALLRLPAATPSTGNFGLSFFHRRPVADVIAERLPATIELTLAALLLALLIAIPLGVRRRSSAAPGRPARHGRIAVRRVAAGLLVRNLLLMLFSVDLKLLPVSGRTSLGLRGVGA